MSLLVFYTNTEDLTTVGVKHRTNKERYIAADQHQLTDKTTEEQSEEMGAVKWTIFRS